MKSIYITLSALLITTQTFAAVNLKQQEAKLASVLKMEQENDYFGAVLTSAQASAEILNQLRIDEIVVSTNTKMTEIRNEIITSKYNQSSGLSILFGLFSGSAQRSWDSAEIITANPEEVDGFSKKVSEDFRKVQNDLKAYVVQNETALSYAKAFTIKTAQLAAKLSVTDRKNLLPMVKTTIQFSQQLRFLGAQTVLKCIETNYANRSRSESAGISGLLGNFGISQSYTQMAYRKTDCSSAVNSTEVSEAVNVSINLNKLDQLLVSHQKQLGLLEVVEAKAEPYQTWGLPSIK